MQKILKRYLAKKTYFKMVSDAYDQMKIDMVCKIQRTARKYITRQR